MIVEGIPRLSPRQRNEAQRFHILIDTLYEAHTLLVASAEVPPQDLYAAGDGSFEFQRTVSRLMEMQSEEYIANREVSKVGLDFPWDILNYIVIHGDGEELLNAGKWGNRNPRFDPPSGRR